MITVKKKPGRSQYSIGSALILAVVLTSLLAIVGVLFVMAARVDKMATSAILENRELDAAVDTVIAKISEQLVLDVPGVAKAEYKDYPDQYDRWLANLEPYSSAGKYYWRQISDVTGRLQGYTRDVQATVLSEYDKVTDFKTQVTTADADGDGVGDSKWVKLDDITSSRGIDIYAAVRIIDNGGMLNANTAYKFDPGVRQRCDGTSQLQVNLMALAGKSGSPPTAAEESDLLQVRANNGVGVDPLDLDSYERNVVWRYAQPNGPYTPFDISDELEIRYRFILNNTGIDTRLEKWGGEFRKSTTLSTPVATAGQELDNWFKRACAAGAVDPNYEYRHLVTTCSMDRIINPAGSTLNNGKMINVNLASVDLLFAALRAAFLDAGIVNAIRMAAQTAVNIVDYRDNDSDVTVFVNPDDGVTYYGFERPCVYISELAYKSVTIDQATYTSYAVELFKPYFEDVDPVAGQWQLVIDGKAIPITWSGTRRFHVIRFEDMAAPPGVRPLLPVTFSDPNEPVDPAAYGYNPASYARLPQDANYTTFVANSRIDLQRQAGGSFITVDTVTVPSGWLNVTGSALSIKRDINRHKCIRRLWTTAAEAGAATLGQNNLFTHSYPILIQAHPQNELFTNIGQIGMVFCDDAYNNLDITARVESVMRLDLRNLVFANIFQYLTVIDPFQHGQPATESRIKGRININTAGWFVLAQLPWVQPPIAQAIIAYRDAAAVPQQGFAGISDLLQVAEMGYYATDPADLTGFPDLTPSDGAGQDFEERDMIFARISNLITVRSDVFTAYVLVRIGTDGPQKRVIAILDRSLVKSPADNVKVIALQPVPDPR